MYFKTLYIITCILLCIGCNPKKDKPPINTPPSGNNKSLQGGGSSGNNEGSQKGSSTIYAGVVLNEAEVPDEFLTALILLDAETVSSHLNNGISSNDRIDKRYNDDEPGITALMLSTITPYFIIEDPSQDMEEATSSLSIDERREEVLNILMNNDADINAKNRFGQTVLIFFIDLMINHHSFGYVEDTVLSVSPLSLKNEIEKPSDELFRDSRYTPPILLDDGMVIHHDHILQARTFQYLIDRGADVNATDKNGLTALTYFFKEVEDRNFFDNDNYHSTQIRILQILIDKEVNVDATDEDDLTPLIKIFIQAERRKDHLDEVYLKTLSQISELLIGAGADVNATDQQRRTGLIIITELMSYLARRDIVLEEGPFILNLVGGRSAINPSGSRNRNSGSSSTGSSGYGTSAGSGSTGGERLGRDYIGSSTSFIQLFIDANRFIDLSNLLDIVNSLIAAGAALDVTDEDGKTALIHLLELASERSDFDILKIVQAFVAANANIHAADNNGNTALTLTIEAENLDIDKKLDIIKILLCSGDALINQQQIEDQVRNQIEHLLQTKQALSLSSLPIFIQLWNVFLFSGQPTIEDLCR